MKMLRKIKGKAMAVCVLVLVCAIWGGMPVSAAEAPAKPELKDPVQNEDNTSEKEDKKKEERFVPRPYTGTKTTASKIKKPAKEKPKQETSGTYEQMSFV